MLTNRDHDREHGHGFDHDGNPHDERHDLGLHYDLDVLARRRAAGVAHTAVPATTAAAPAAAAGRLLGAYGTPVASRFLDRRAALALIGGVGFLSLAACRSSNTGTTVAQNASATTPASSGSLTVIPSETAGPFPGDGSNGPNVLNQSGIVRSDIRTSFGSSSGTAAGIPLTVTLTVVNLSDGGSAHSGAAIYLWHCDREGRYSLYSQGVTNQNYLRGVQAAGADGTVTFTTTFPAAYPGRWPHMHFEVYPSLDKAVVASSRLATSQVALPEASCKLVYVTAGYEQSVRSLAQTSLKSDMVFGNDGGIHQLATMTGSVASGFTAALRVPVKA